MTRCRTIQLPVCKSIANRLMLLQAIHHDPLLELSTDMPDDLFVMHHALTALQQFDGNPLTLDLHDSGTAMRFLDVHLALHYPNQPITITGSKQLMSRRGKPTTQTASARILEGFDDTNLSSPYIEMSRKMVQSYPDITLERDWSSAAFWYEYMALHPSTEQTLLLNDLHRSSLQGDQLVAALFEPLGVLTTYAPQGVVLSYTPSRNITHIRFDANLTPDLYPAFALTCERLGVTIELIGEQRLRYKESNRIEAVKLHQSCSDHRMAMALIAADLPCDDTECIRKSYPSFLKQFVF